MKTRRLLIVLMAAALLVAAASAQKEEVKSSERFSLFTAGDEPLEITAEAMSADNVKRIVVFTGQVTVVQGEARLTSQTLEIRYREGEADSQIQKVVASGDVEMTEKDRRAVCSQAVYNGDTGIIVLTGEPEVWQGQDHIKGAVIEMYVDEDRVRVKSDPAQPVRVILFPKGDEGPAKDSKPENGKADGAQPD